MRWRGLVTGGDVRGPWTADNTLAGEDVGFFDEYGELWAYAVDDDGTCYTYCVFGGVGGILGIDELP